MRRIEDNDHGTLFSVHYSQRDLEDQIEEEYKTQGRKYQRININNSNNMSSSTTPEIVVQDVLNLLKQGYTRLARGDKGYGSIQHHYDLTPGQVGKLFKHPKLKAKKTIPPAFNIVDRDESLERFVETTAIRVGGEVIPVQDVVVTSTEAPVPTVNSTSREQLFK